MNLPPIDLILGLLILLLGLKGALTGFRREIFGFVGLIGGVFVASRSAAPLAALVEEHLFRMGNPAALRMIAFVLVLTLVWGGVSFLGRIAEKRGAERVPTLPERFGGFLLAAGKYFLVFAMILTALHQAPAIRGKLQRQLKGSQLFLLMQPAGRFLLNPSGAGTPPQPGTKHSPTRS